MQFQNSSIYGAGLTNTVYWWKVVRNKKSYLAVGPVVGNASNGASNSLRDHAHFALFPAFPDPVRNVKEKTLKLYDNILVLNMYKHWLFGNGIVASDKLREFENKM